MLRVKPLSEQYCHWQNQRGQNKESTAKKTHIRALAGSVLHKMDKGWRGCRELQHSGAQAGELVNLTWICRTCKFKTVWGERVEKTLVWATVFQVISTIQGGGDGQVFSVTFALRLDNSYNDSIIIPYIHGLDNSYNHVPGSHIKLSLGPWPSAAKQPELK